MPSSSARASRLALGRTHVQRGLARGRDRALARRRHLRQHRLHSDQGAERRAGHGPCALHRPAHHRGRRASLRADRFFINVGGRPAQPGVQGLDSVSWLTNASIMRLTELPRYLVVVGGSYIGLEFAQMFRRFGAEVSVVQRGPQLVPREDADVAEALRALLEDEGLTIRTGAECVRLAPAEGGAGAGGDIAVHVDCQRGDPVLRASHVLVATGRRPNTDDLGLEHAGVALDERGNIVVDDRLVSSVPHIWALGDCNGRGAFTHTSWNDFEVVAANLFDGASRGVGQRLVTYALYTDPPLARIGLSEREVRATGRPALIGTRPMTRVGRAVEKGEDKGFIKILVDQETQAILGASILGVDGDEAIHSLLDVTVSKRPYTEVMNGVRIHPTVSELLPTVLQIARHAIAPAQGPSESDTRAAAADADAPCAGHADGGLRAGRPGAGDLELPGLQDRGGAQARRAGPGPGDGHRAGRTARGASRVGRAGGLAPAGASSRRGRFRAAPRGVAGLAHGRRPRPSRRRPRGHVARNAGLLHGPRIGHEPPRPGREPGVVDIGGVPYWSGQGDAGPWRVIIAERTLDDRTLLSAIWRELAGSMLLAFPLVLLPLWIAVRRGMRPLTLLARAVDRRDAQDLAPLASHPSMTSASADAGPRRGRTPRGGRGAEPRAGTRLASEPAAARAGQRRRQPRRGGGGHRSRGAGAGAAGAGRAEAARRGIELALDAPSALALHVDRLALESVLGNLIENALRYVPAGGQVALIVADDGPGIAPAHREEAFERFWRGEQAGEISGTGLGLAIVREAAHRLGGEASMADGLARADGGVGLAVVVRWRRVPATT
ncbi:pyridine nucleotide-disulfide oxidoreductase domain-containing protein [Ditylenchus destructor]|nr:pyridine nucleotide-disulfide oxidoreductase domain-containing protein [Ditylenchus destructor]